MLKYINCHSKNIIFMILLDFMISVQIAVNIIYIRNTELISNGDLMLFLWNSNFRVLIYTPLYMFFFKYRIDYLFASVRRLSEINTVSKLILQFIKHEFMVIVTSLLQYLLLISLYAKLLGIPVLNFFSRKSLFFVINNGRLWSGSTVYFFYIYIVGSFIYLFGLWCVVFIFKLIENGKKIFVLMLFYVIFEYLLYPQYFNFIFVNLSYKFWVLQDSIILTAFIVSVLIFLLTLNLFSRKDFFNVRK